MKTYHGKRTEQGCEVTVDGEPLQMRSNLSGNATTAFDWGYVGTGQLSLALLSDLLGNDAKAKAMCEAFENAVVANLPHDSWTMTDHDLAHALAIALAPLVGVDGARADAANAGDTPAEEAVNAINRAADEALALARTSMDEAKRLLAKPLSKIGRGAARPTARRSSRRKFNPSEDQHGR